MSTLTWGGCVVAALLTRGHAPTIGATGKTYTSIQRLIQAKSGVFCGPLRLLALEIYETLNMAGVVTNLVTGQELREMDWANHVACTVEMCNLDKQVDVAVIDEIQLIGDPHRGWAWTQALLGVQAAEVHVCGDPSAIPVVQRLAELTGDDFEICEYERRCDSLSSSRETCVLCCSLGCVQVVIDCAGREPSR